MLLPNAAESQQLPLIHEVHTEDTRLLNTLDGEWFEILHRFPWENYRQHAAAYYDALYEFNISEHQPSAKAGETATDTETKEEAKQRLLFDRATMQMTQDPPPAIIYQGNVVEFKAPKVTSFTTTP